MFEAFETDSVRSWGTSPCYNVQTGVSAAEQVRCVKFCSGLLWLLVFFFGQRILQPGVSVFPDMFC